MHLCLDDLACLDAAGADANPLGATLDLGLDRTQVDVPTAPGDVVGVRDIVSECGPLPQTWQTCAMTYSMISNFFGSQATRDSAVGRLEFPSCSWRCE